MSDINETETNPVETEELADEEFLNPFAMQKALFGEGNPSAPMFDQSSSRKVIISLPTLDTLGVSQEVPTVEVVAESDGSNLTIHAKTTALARTQQEYDAIIHLLGTAL